MGFWEILKRILKRIFLGQKSELLAVGATAALVATPIASVQIYSPSASEQQEMAEMVANLEAQSKTWASGSNNQLSSEEMEQEFISQVLEQESQTGEYSLNKEKQESYFNTVGISDGCKDLAIVGADGIIKELTVIHRTENSSTIIHQKCTVEQTKQLENSSFGATMKGFIEDFSILVFVYDFIFGDGSLRAATSELFDYLAKKGKGLPYLVIAGVLNRFKKSRKKEDK